MPERQLFSGDRNDMPCLRRGHLCNGTDERINHVNRCLDAEDHFSLTASRIAQQKLAACPICFQESECHIDHLKKCAKQRSVLPKDLIHIIQQYEKETGTSIKSRKKVTRVRKAASAPCKRQPKKKENETPVSVTDADMEETIPHKDSKSCQSVHFRKTLNVRSGRLTIFVELPEQKDVQEKLNTMLKNSVATNFRASESPVPLPAMFQLSHLLVPHYFVARGFETLVKKTPSLPLQHAAAVSESESGFLKESTVIEIDKRDELFDLLWQQKYKKSADLLIRTDAGDEIACHSFVWCMNTGKAHLTRCGSMFRVDCSPFPKSITLSFVAFCYSARLRIQADEEEAMRRFCSHFQCSDRLFPQ